MPKRKAKNPAAVELGRLGGSRKVPKGLAMLDPEQRRAIATKAARTRWAKTKQKKKKK